MIDLHNPERMYLGKQAFITRSQPLLDEVCAIYGREPSKCCIKVFYSNPLTKTQDIKSALWGDDPRPTDVRKNTTVFAGSQVQNILWRHNLSPRVFAVFDADLSGDRVACQLTEFVEGNPAEKIEEVYKMWEDTQYVGKDYGFSAISKKMSPNDVIGGKNVDPQLWAFDNKPYKEVVENIYYEKGRYGKIYYQCDDELGFHGGPRKSEDRVGYMKLEEVDFTGKVVYDLGCAGGFFLRYASKRGAKREIGFDLKEPLEAAFHAGNYLGHFNIDYVEADLKRGIPNGDLPKADIAFFLSMNLHVGLPEQLKEIPFIIFEDNSYDGRGKDMLEDKFWLDNWKDIKFVGRGLDHGDKAVYHLRK